MKPKYLRTKGAAEYIGLSKSALAKSRIQGHLFGIEPPPYRKVGTSDNAPVLYAVNDLDAWVEKFSKVANTAEEGAL